MKQPDCDFFHAGSMPEVSAEEIKKLAFEKKFATEAQGIFGPKYRLRVKASCVTTPGWTIFNFRTSDKHAVSTSFYRHFLEGKGPINNDVDISVEDMVIAGERGAFIETILSLHHPEDLDTWLVEFLASSHNEASPPLTILPNSKPVTVFPRVESVYDLPHHAAVPDTFPEGHICLLELWRNIGLHSTFPPSLPVSLLWVKSPIRTNSQWRAVKSHASKCDFPEELPERFNNRMVTRFYASSNHFGTYTFERFSVDNVYHYVSFASS